VALSQLLTSCELGQSKNIEKGNGRIVLITGQGGVGKSTLIGELIECAIESNTSIAVIANDPSGAQDRGAILADRLRMPMGYAGEQCFIRSMSVDDPSVGIAQQTEDMALALSSQYDLIIVETLGVSQHQYVSPDWVDLSLAAISPGTGDQWQLRKSAILDVCDAVCITKSDMSSYEMFRQDVADVIHDKRQDQPEILSVSQQDKQSIADAFSFISKAK
ncbi:MAG: hypothetical protein HRU15_06700, partial [Planctomycetes bacterium]|nr:hypothetical protein [Planctomycetota bacterium]